MVKCEPSAKEKDVDKQRFFFISTWGVVLLLFRYEGSPYKRGFFCDDESLQHPYKESTVPSYMLYLVGFIGGAVLMSVVEMLRIHAGLSAPCKDNKGQELRNRRLVIARDVYQSLVPFCFGAIAEHTLTDIGKYGLGRLRPHFFDVCNIDFSKVNCSSGYIEDFTCTNEDENKIREVRLSFPSGHSSFATYIAIYLFIYLQVRLTFLFNSLIRPFLQTVIMALAWYTALSRISDYKHHPTDVLGGALVGIFSAVSVAYCASNLFPQNTRQQQITQGSNMDNFNTSL